MAKALDAVEFTRQVATKTMEHLGSLTPLPRIGEGALVKITMRGGDGHAEFLQGHVISHTGSGDNEALRVRSGHRGHFRMLAIPMNSPDLLSVDILRDFSTRRVVKGFMNGKPKSAKIKKSRTVLSKSWRHGSVRSATYQSRNQAIAGLVERAVAETVAEDQAVIVSGLDPAAVDLAKRISSMVGDIRDAGSNDRIEKLVELMLPATDPIAEVRSKIEVDNASLRTRFLTQVPALTAADIAAAAGSKASNKSATANRWKTSGQIFSVSQGGREVFPAFQFAHGNPRPVMGKLLAILQPHRSAWETAFWFVSSNPWLDGIAPADRLDDEAAVIAAAERSIEGLPS